mgnify:CR=1 FL=1
MTIATFGQKKEGVEYSNRYGVYAVMPWEGVDAGLGRGELPRLASSRRRN